VLGPTHRNRPNPYLPERERRQILDNAAVYWNGVANGLAVKYGKSPFETIRGLAIVSVADYNAAAAAERAGTGRVHP